MMPSLVCCSSIAVVIFVIFTFPLSLSSSSSSLSPVIMCTLYPFFPPVSSCNTPVVAVRVALAAAHAARLASSMGTSSCTGASSSIKSFSSTMPGSSANMFECAIVTSSTNSSVSIIVQIKLLFIMV